MKRVVLALGGNALGNSPTEQLEAVKVAAKPIVDVMEDVAEVAIVHGNGPQVGVINLGMGHAHEAGIGVPEFPLVECVAMSQGYIGYQLQQALQIEAQARGLKKCITTLVTQVQVDEEDPAFQKPTKPIGNFYSKEEAEKIEKEKGYTFVEDAGRGYRRVVPSPNPKHIVEIDSIKKMMAQDITVITGGGGGVPVVDTEAGYKGVDAVIDKDFVAAKLSQDIDADTLIILTAVEKVCINFNKENEEALGHINKEEALKYIDEGQFAPGSMLPKVEACLRFIGEDENRKAIITSLDRAQAALKGETGTVISLK